MATKKTMATSKKNAKSAPDSTEAAGFRGFGSHALLFLRALAENNDRDWFNLNKSTYLEECDAPLRELVQEIGAGLESKGVPLAPVAKNPVFRIYRDVRFSTDKSPYKTNLGAALYRDGDKSRPGLFYIHIEPGQSFFAAGFYHPEPPVLKEYRSAIAADPSGLANLVRALESKGLKLDNGEPLARMPKGFEDQAESPVAAILRKRSLITSRPLADDDLERPDLADVAIQFATAALPLLEYFQARVEKGD